MQEYQTLRRSNLHFMHLMYFSSFWASKSNFFVMQTNEIVYINNKTNLHYRFCNMNPLIFRKIEHETWIWTPKSQISLQLMYFCSFWASKSIFFCHATIKIAYLNSKTNLYYRLVQYENFISNNLEDIVWNMNLTPQIPISVHLTILQVLGIYINKIFWHANHQNYSL